MHLTKGQAKLGIRLCKYVGAACLVGIVCLLGIGNKHESLPPVVGFAQTSPHADPVVYKQFVQLQANLDDPFSFQESSLNKRSFVVEEEEEIRPEPELEPELDTDELNLMAILREKGRRFAILNDIRDSKITRVRVGDTVRGAEVVSIGQDHLVLHLQGKDFQLSWKGQEFSE